ncbi:MAG: hypothetical protein Q4P33_05880 [Flaviflexus sp.]|nr:hypothetical protein [Flaviflexus sp.]
MRISSTWPRRIIVMVTMTLGGILACLALGLLIELLAQRTSFPGIFGRGDRLGEPVLLWVCAALGALFGLGAGAAVLGESLRIDVSTPALTLAWGDARVRVRREIITDIALGGDLIIYGTGGIELARVSLAHVDTDRLSKALQRYGYPEPSFTEIGIFSPDLSTLPAPARRIIARRQEALAAGNDEIAELLRRQLVAMGIMVRDVGRGRRSSPEVRTVDLTRPRAPSPA